MSAVVIGLVLAGRDMGTAIVLVDHRVRRVLDCGPADAVLRDERRGARRSASWCCSLKATTRIGPHRRVAQPGDVRHQGRLQADHPRHVGARLRRAVGPRPRHEPREVGRPSRARFRLHLRDHRRGVRPHRHAARALRLRHDGRSPSTASCTALATRSCRSRAAPSARGSSARRASTSRSSIGLLPVTGLPLPLVSSGGSSLIASMAAVGVLMAFARAEPGAPEAFAARPVRGAPVARP